MNDTNPPPSGGLQDMLARLRGMSEAMKADESEPDAEEILPAWDAPALAERELAAAIPLATPVEAQAAAEAPMADSVAEAAVAVVEEAEPAPPVPQLCPLCKAPRVDSFCMDCGFIFPDEVPAPVASANPGPAVMNPTPKANSKTKVKGRYQLGELVSQRGDVERFKAQDFGENGAGPAVPVVILRAPAKVEEVLEAEEVIEEAIPVAEEDELLPTFDFPPAAVPTAQPATAEHEILPVWPTLAWERTLLEHVATPSLPAVVDDFVEGGFEYLVEEVPAGQSLWDVWDDPDGTCETRFLALRQVAEAMHALHEHGAMLEAIRPHIVVVQDGQAKITDLADLLPLPVPADAPIRAGLYTAPELASFSPGVDARAGLYSFGSMLYSLHVGRELTEMDFNKPGEPKPFVPRWPDIHPLFGRLVAKTFCKQVLGRFPSDEAARDDATGFSELIKVLEVCRRTLDNVRLEVAAWTTTGMIRTGNEDAFALIQAVESRQDDMNESVLALLADGMGGYEAGEIAAGLAIEQLRKLLLQNKLCTQVAGGSSFPPNGGKPEADPPKLDVAAMKKLIREALIETNKFVYTASRSGIGRRGMGCTAEVVFVDSRNVVVGHVGDSRTYHLHEGQLIQLTRDQTLVNRLVELGQLTAEEAEHHPRKNELQQAVGGQPTVEPGIYSGIMKPGDWVVVCSDGVTNHVKDRDLKEMLLSEAGSAEIAARRLVNLVNIEGATDNATVVVIRAT
jgi:serine/threonine protein phosphatase PrpC